MSLHLKDQLGREIVLHQFPKRIVSLVPSITETLFDLKLKDRIVGRTKFCIHPKGVVSHAKIIGGTKNVNISRINALFPDLILANKEENTKEIVDELTKTFPTYVSDVKTITDALELIKDLGDLTGQIIESQDLAKEIMQAKESYIPEPLKRAVYLIWKDPYMTVGNDSFIHHMMLESGFQNIYSDKTRYPMIELEDRIMETDIILLSSEPYPFKLKDVKALIKQFGKPVLLVNGEMYSWYGSRMKMAWPYFAGLSAT